MFIRRVCPDYGTAQSRFVLAVLLTSCLYRLGRFSSLAWSNGVSNPVDLVKLAFDASTLDWSRQIVIVTGGSGGIGTAIVSALSKRRPKAIVILDRTSPSSSSLGVGTRFYECDLTNERAIRSTIERIREEVGAPTIVVNNAGIVSGKSISDVSVDEFKRTLDVNVVAPFAIVQAVLPDMLKLKRGHVVSIASVFAIQGCSQLCSSLTLSLSQDSS